MFANRDGTIAESMHGHLPRSADYVLHQLVLHVRSLAPPSGVYASLSDRAVAIIDVTSALLGTRPDETTFSSMTSPGVAMML